MMANFQIVHSNVRCSVRLSGQVIIMACYSKTMTAYQVRRCLPVCDSYNTLCPTFKSHKRKGADQHVIPVSFTGSQITTSLLRRSFDLEIVTQTVKNLLTADFKTVDVWYQNSWMNLKTSLKITKVTHFNWHVSIIWKFNCKYPIFKSFQTIEGKES